MLTQMTGEIKDLSAGGKKGSRQNAIFVARDKFTLLNKLGQVCFSSYHASFTIYCLLIVLLSSPPLCHGKIIISSSKVHNLSNSIAKTIKPPVQMNKIFYDGTAKSNYQFYIPIVLKHPACELHWLERG